MLRKLLVGVVLTVGLIVSPSVSFAAVNETTEFASPVIDTADMFTHEQERTITQAFNAEHDNSGLVFVVETVPTINGQDLQSYTVNRANELGVGDAETNNGVFMLVVRDDRLFQIEPGSGVSTVVSSSTIQSIVDNTALPSFKQGNYVGGVVDSANQVGSAFANPVPAPTPAEPVDVTGFFIWTGIILGGIVAVIVLIVIIVALVKWRQRVLARRKQKLDDTRYFKTQETVKAMTESDAFKTAVGETGRYNVIRAELADYLAQDPVFEKQSLSEIHRSAVRALITRQVREAKGAERYTSIDVNDLEDISLSKYFASPEFASKVESSKAAEAAELQRQRERAEQQRLAEKRRIELQKKQEKEAKTYWKGLSSSAKNEIRRARSRSEKIRVMERYNNSGLDMNYMFPILLALYVSDLGSTSAYGSSSSGSSSYGGSYGSSSSSSSSSSYDSGSSFSSFGGGSFDGGGGGGSW